MRRAALAAPLAILLIAGGCKAAPRVAETSAASMAKDDTHDCAGVPEIALTGRVTDAANILPAAEKARLSERLALYEQRTAHQMVVATAPTLGGFDVGKVGDCLGNRWGIGDRDRDDGVLILVAPNDRRVRISTGIGMEDMFSDEEAKAVIERMTSYFKSSDYAGGLWLAVDAIAAETGDKS